MTVLVRLIGLIALSVSAFANVNAMTYRAQLLNPTGAPHVVAVEVADSTIVGYRTEASGNLHAIRWHGAIPSAVDLHPSGFVESRVATV